MSMISRVRARLPANSCSAVVPSTPAVDRREPPRTVSPLGFRLAALMLAIMLAGVAGALLAARALHPAAYPDAFASYESLMPGAAIDGLAAYACEPIEEGTDRPLWHTVRDLCGLMPRDGSFQLILIRARDTGVTQVLFYAERLRLGDLLAHWGRPAARTRIAETGAWNYQWRGDAYTVMITSDSVRVDAPVRMVTVSAR